MPLITRRKFTSTSLAAILGSHGLAKGFAIELPPEHVAVMRARTKRIVVQQDVHWVMLNYGKLHADDDAPFDPFCKAVFSYVDEPGSQIDAIWWDIGGNATGSVYPSKVVPDTAAPLVERWYREGTDWVERLVAATRRRKLEVFWNHRISEVEVMPQGGLAKEADPLKKQHLDWVVPASWWPHGMWNLASPELREHKLSVLREIATLYDLDGIQIDFARHVPCLPVGKQWELRHHVTEFMRMVRCLTLEIAKQRGRPFLLAARVPQNVEGCRADGFDVQTWAQQHLVDVLTLGSRTMDVDVEGIRRVVGSEIQLQPCFDDHHATDGYRYAPIDVLRGVFANHLQRGANSVVTFNWAVATPDVAKTVGGEIAPLTHQIAFKEIGDPNTLAGKDKVFAVERRGGYPWAEGFFNRNDTAPLPTTLARAAKLTLFISDAPSPKASLVLRCIFFQADAKDVFELRMNGEPLTISSTDPDWKDAQIFSPKPQPASGGKGDYKINPSQRLLRIEAAVPDHAWKQGVNAVEIRVTSGTSSVQLEKLEAHLNYKSA